MDRSAFTPRTLLLFCGLAFLAWLVYLVRGTVVLFGIALMLMATLHPLVQLAERRGLSHSKAVALVMLGLVLVPLGIIAALTPLAISEVQGFAASFPRLQQHVDELLQTFGLATKVNEAIDKANLQNRVSDFAVVLAAPTLAFVTATFEVVVIAGYLLADSRRIQLWLHEYVPRLSERHIEPLLEGMERVVGGYIRGQLLTSAMFGVFAFLLCLTLRVPYPLLLGIIAAIGDVIPLFGVQVAMIVAALVAFTNSTWQPVAVIIGFVVYGQVESHVLVPRIYSRTVNLSPLLVILATILGAKLYGIVGILIGIPIVGVIKVVFDYVVAERTRGREGSEQVMAAEPTDEVEQELVREVQGDAVEAGQEDEAETDEAAGIPTPSYSPFESVPVETSLYQRFLSALGLTAADLEQRFAAELDHLTPEEQRDLGEFAAGEAVQLTDAQQAVLHRMLTRAAIKVEQQAGAEATV